MVSANNPAGRLYNLLDRLRSHSDTLPLRDAWAEVLNGDPIDDGALLLQIAEVVRLLKDTKDSIARQPVEHELYFRPFIKIQRIFTFSFTHNVGHTKQELDEATMVGLEHCAELLARTSGEKIIDDDQLKSIQTDIDALIERILGGELPRELSGLLLDNLQGLRQAILNFRIHGTDGLQDALKSCLGSFHYYNLHEHQAPPPSESARGVVRDFISVVEQLLSIVANAKNLIPIAGGVASLLLGSGS